MTREAESRDVERRRKTGIEGRQPPRGRRINDRIRGLLMTGPEKVLRRRVSLTMT